MRPEQEEFDKARMLLGHALMGRMFMAQIRAMQKAFKAGQRAHFLGFERVSPYYEEQVCTPYWLAGYDGLEFILPEVEQRPAAEQRAADHQSAPGSQLPSPASAASSSSPA